MLCIYPIHMPYTVYIYKIPLSVCQQCMVYVYASCICKHFNEHNSTCHSFVSSDFVCLSSFVLWPCFFVYPMFTLFSSLVLLTIIVWSVYLSFCLFSLSFIVWTSCLPSVDNFFLSCGINTLWHFSFVYLCLQPSISMTTKDNVL